MRKEIQNNWLSRIGGTVVSACVMSDMGDEQDEGCKSTLGQRKITIDIDDLDLG